MPRRSRLVASTDTHLGAPGLVAEDDAKGHGGAGSRRLAGLPDDQQMEPFGLFSVTPIGAALILSGIAYFMIFGKWVLPAVHHRDGSSGQSMHEYLKRLYGLDADIFEVSVHGKLLSTRSFQDDKAYHSALRAAPYHRLVWSVERSI